MTERLNTKEQFARSIDSGEPIGRLPQEDWKALQQRRFFEQTMALGVYPVIDKDAAEEILEDYRFARGRRHPRVPVIEERIRDGHPIFTHIAISRLRGELARLIDDAQSQLTPRQQVLVPAQTENIHIENR